MHVQPSRIAAKVGREIRFEIWVVIVYIPPIKGVSVTNELNFSKGLQ
jgi:hypothetical protein